MMICDDCRYVKQALVTDGNGNKRVMLGGCYLKEIPVCDSETGEYKIIINETNTLGNINVHISK